MYSGYWLGCRLQHHSISFDSRAEKGTSLSVPLWGRTSVLHNGYRGPFRRDEGAAKWSILRIAFGAEGNRDWTFTENPCKTWLWTSFKWNGHFTDTTAFTKCAYPYRHIKLNACYLNLTFFLEMGACNFFSMWIKRTSRISRQIKCLNKKWNAVEQVYFN
jgi:hypothetical protein